MLEKFRQGLKQVTFKVPEIPYISTLTGHWIRKEEAVDPVYWTRHLRETVRFAGGLTELLKEEHALFVELGPGRVLCTVAMQHPGKKKSQQVLNLLKHPDQEVSDRRYLLSRLGLLWIYGTHIDWTAFYEGEKRNRIPLPTYSFDRYRYPVDVSALGKSLLSYEKFGYVLPFEVISILLLAALVGAIVIAKGPRSSKNIEK